MFTVEAEILLSRVVSVPVVLPEVRIVLSIVRILNVVAPLILVL